MKDQLPLLAFLALVILGVAGSLVTINHVISEQAAIERAKVVACRCCPRSPVVPGVRPTPRPYPLGECPIRK